MRTLVFALLLALALPLSALADAPTFVPVQGFLTDAAGVPVEGETTLDLALYDAEVEGAPIFTESQLTLVEGGYFTVYLGQVTPLDLALFRDNGALWLGITVDTGAEMTPRLPVGTTPFAAFAQYAGDALHAGTADDASSVGGLTPAELQQVGGPVEWANLANVPPDIADGDDDTITTYTGTDFALSNQSCPVAGDLVLGVAADGTLVCGPSPVDITALISGGQLSAVAASGDYADLTNTPTTITDLVGACLDQDVPKWDMVSSSWACAPDIDTDTDTLAALGCGAAGQVAQWNGAAWVCAPDARGDITEVIAGTGLSGGSATGVATLSVDQPWADARYVQEGEPNSISGAMITDGSVSDADVAASAAIDPSKILGTAWTGTNDGAASGLDADLLDGQHGAFYQKWANLTGVPAGFSDNIDDDTTYTPGAGLALAGTTFSLDPAYGQLVHWARKGNAGTIPGVDYLGTSDNVGLTLAVNAAPVMRYEPGLSPNIVGGDALNTVTAGAYGATIAGGGDPSVLSFPNQVTDFFGTVGGGRGNQAGDGAGTTDDRGYATVGGGDRNIASGSGATIGGGSTNTASGPSSVVGGGRNNTASGIYSTLGGGQNNAATGTYSTLAGGRSNIASGLYSTLPGGRNNIASAPHSTVGGGRWGIVSASYGTIGGGGGVLASDGNNVTDDYGTVGGGSNNQAGDALGTPADRAYATVAGGRVNTASGLYSAVAGGYTNTASGSSSAVAGGNTNTASGDASAVAGGSFNFAGGAWSAVAGGRINTASGSYSTVAGGYASTASGYASTVAGGQSNVAAGALSFAAGNRAKANLDGCFVWGDSTAADVACSATNAFVARASGGYKLWSDTGLTTGVSLLPGSGTWSSLSDRNMKSELRSVDPGEVLERVAALPLSTWRYKSQSSKIRHMGPMAQDFYAAFGLGSDERHITTIDSAGVSLAAIQGLYNRMEEQSRQHKARIATLEERIERLEALLEESLRR